MPKSLPSDSVACLVGHPYEQGFDLRLVPEKLSEPLKWKAPRFIFVDSMSDLFQAGVPDDYIIRVAQVMNTAKWHTFQVLTKRADRMRCLLNSKLRFAARSAHIWWGVSVENRKHGLPRVEELRAASVAMRFLSVEPLLEDLGLLRFGRHLPTCLSENTIPQLSDAWPSFSATCLTSSSRAAPS